MVVAYFLTFATLTVLAHEAYRTTAFDLGSMDQAIWNTLHGRFFRATVQPGVEIRLGEHRRKLEEEVASPCFRIVDGHLVDR